VTISPGNTRALTFRSDDVFPSRRVRFPLRGTYLSSACGEFWSRDLCGGSRFDLCLTSPPYEDARAYGIGFKLRGRDWVTWAADRFMDDLAASSNAVAWVVDGKTVDRRWSGTPFDLWCELRNRGAALRKPIIYRRSGIPGKTDYLRNDYEIVIVAAADPTGRFAYSDPLAIGSPPKFKYTGAMSNRSASGARDARGRQARPAIANPGNVFSGSVGGGKMGSRIAEAHDAPFPLWLAARLVRMLCPPGGRVLDRFAGSGTTLAAAGYLGRSAFGCDVDPWSAGLCMDRIEEVRQHAARFDAGDHASIPWEPLSLLRAGVTDRTTSRERRGARGA